MGKSAKKIDAVLDEYGRIARSALETRVVIKHDGGRGYVEIEPREKRSIEQEVVHEQHR